MSKPREYHINPKGTWLKVTDLTRNDKHETHVHVIEKSAYDKAVEALKIANKNFHVNSIETAEADKKIAETLKELGEE